MPWEYMQKKDKFVEGTYIREEKNFNLQSVKIIAFFRDFMLHDWSDLRFEWSEALRLVTLATCANLSNILNVG